MEDAITITGENLITASAGVNSHLEFERREFRKLQQDFRAQFETAFPDKMAPKTVVIIPSLTLDNQILQKIDGVNFYEERMLCLLMLLRMPQTHIVYITSMPVDPVIVDYYLHLLPGITAYHAKQRLTMLSCFDASSISLTKKIVDRPRLLKRIKAAIPDRHLAHLACFNVTEVERKLSVALQIPVYGCDPDLQHLGNKSNGRKIFRACGIPVPFGFEDLQSEADVAEALMELKRNNPQLKKAVVKINDGFSGEGNAIFSFAGWPDSNQKSWLRTQLPAGLQMVASDLSYSQFVQKLEGAGGVVEEFIEGADKSSPSVQCRVNPSGKVDVISTHDQVLGGKSNQVYIGAAFPANHQYAAVIGSMGRRIAEELRHYGVLGRFSADFISVKEGNEWKHYAIEINLRKGGTTHPYLMLQFLTCGEYKADEGVYFAAGGARRYYVCSDNLQNEKYKGLTPHDLIDIAMCNELLYDSSSQEGVMFHLISALSQFGKLGLVCIGATPDKANFYYQKTLAVLDREAGGSYVHQQ